MLGWGKNLSFVTEFFIDYVPYYNKFRAVTMAMIIAEFGIALLATLALNKFLNKEDNKEKDKKLKLAFYITGGITLLLSIIPSLFLDFHGSMDNIWQENRWPVNLLQDYRADILSADAWRSFVFILLAFGALWMFLKGSLKKKYVVVVFGVLILVDMWSVDKRYLNNSDFKQEQQFQLSQANQNIYDNNKKRYRVMNLNNPYNESKTSYKNNSIGGYHAAKLLRYQEIIDRQIPHYETKQSQNWNKNQKTPFFLQMKNKHVLSMLNCGWIIKYKGKEVGFETKDSLEWNQLKLLPPLGDSWFVSEVKEVENANQEMNALNSFNPKTTAIVDKRFLNKIKSFSEKNKSDSIWLDQSSYKPNHLTYILKNITSAKLAVFSEIYYEKGWNAYIDGKLVPHFRANYVLRAMMVPAGTTKIEFKFEPTSYSTGETVAYASSIILLLLLGFVSYKEFK